MVWILYNYVMFNISSREKDDLDNVKTESPRCTNRFQCVITSNVIKLIGCKKVMGDCVSCISKSTRYWWIVLKHALLHTGYSVHYNARNYGSPLVPRKKNGDKCCIVYFHKKNFKMFDILNCTRVLYLQWPRRWCMFGKKTFISDWHIIFFT